MLANKGGLTNVCEKKTGEGETKPADLDRSHAESPEVRKQSFNPGESKQNTSEAPPAIGLVTNQVLKSMYRVEGYQHRMIVPCQIEDTKAGVEKQPDNDDGRKRGSELAGTEGLDQEQDDQYARSCPDHGRFSDIWNDHIETLYRTKNGLSWGQNAVRHDHRHGKNTNRLEQSPSECTVLDSTTKSAARALQITGAEPLQLYQGCFTRIAVRDVELQ